MGHKFGPMSEEHKRKISEANKGRKLTLEQKHKISEVNKLRYAKGERFGFQKGNKLADNPKAVATRFKKGNPKLKNAFKWNSGKEHPNWKGGVTPEHEKIRKSNEYVLWRKAVFERDNYQCIWCFARSSKGKAVILHADHIKPFTYFPELRFAIDNGRTLCKDCHMKTDTWGKKVYKYANIKTENSV